jgi:surface protein
MSNMFEDCLFLYKISLENFKTENVIDMSSMFKGCEQLQQLNQNFNTKNVKNMSKMFNFCSSLYNI